MRLTQEQFIMLLTAFSVICDALIVFGLTYYICLGVGVKYGLCILATIVLAKMIFHGKLWN